ncbi:unnamed protein product [Cyprideis torosa]|uniref:CWH43-like N-terminal domain-containing protein n=1 Tax=Cyprideis torosa TaxID=163714 RepID=A0A7R8ZTK5_9CRUS|nr:unnamed protein product [Cyprideis torosa]CAG0898275.1 unnamed protein product [Cyprideis torosa]
MAEEETRPPGLSFSHTYLSFRFKDLCIAMWTVPWVGMWTCFLSALSMHGTSLNVTKCNVYNFIPSLSAVTGVSPQCYIWRASVALNGVPRLCVLLGYRSLFRSSLHGAPAPESQIRPPSPHEGTGDTVACAKTDHGKVEKVIDVTCVLGLIEAVAFSGVTFVSNKENYDIHEKFFVTFMTASLLYMLLTLYLMCRTGLKNRSSLYARSFAVKRFLFGFIIMCTCILLIFFYKHRFLCHDLAFSWFSLSEYFVAVSNYGFHVTSVWDFPDYYVSLVGPTMEPMEAENKKQKNA